MNTIRAAFVADALCLGPHWVYDQEKLLQAYPDGVTTTTAPVSEYHSEKKAGDFTHYGDQLLIALRSAAANPPWSQDSFEKEWENYFRENSSSYVDGATRETLTRLTDPTAPESQSNDIAGASRSLLIPPLLEGQEADAIIQAARTQTAFTHGDAETIDTAELFTRILLGLQNGTTLVESLEESCRHRYGTLDAQSYLEKVKNYLAANESRDPLHIAKEIGLSCHTPDALPLILYTLLRFNDDLEAALKFTALAGGDNAARAIPIAILMTSASGWSEFMETLFSQVNAQPTIDQLLVEIGSN
tara:strand:- start:39720 stop:40625 length:906 start_codon:yes stop_codon:yes gene_type:complete